MDGFSKKVNISLQHQLSFRLSLTIIIVAVIAGIFSFIIAYEEAKGAQSDTLKQLAYLLERLPPIVGQTSPLSYEGGDPESYFFVQWQSPNGSRSSSHSDLLSFPSPLKEGLQQVEKGEDSWQLFVKTLPSGMRLVVGQETTSSDEMVRDAALRMVIPFLILIPVLLLVMTDLIRKMFSPLSQLVVEVNLRGEQDLHSVSERGLPIEVQPFVAAINRLLDCVKRSVSAQQRFIADAAHELRTPVAALSLQLERLEQTNLSEEAHERLTVMQKGVERSRALLEQLLSLARVQASYLPEKAMLESVSIPDVFRRVLENLFPLVEKKQLDIGVTSTEAIKVTANMQDVMILVTNLVDNAIRYTPERGRIDLFVTGSSQSIELGVEDSGPGIPPSERDRVFDPFYRVVGSESPGSGLGLSIVKSLVDKLGADIQLSQSQCASSGLRVVVRIPL